jgi:four helix bundle protein
MELVDEVYDLAESFPARERFGMWSQITRAGVSVPTNIAEGQARGTSKDFANFLTMAWSSLQEIDTLLLVAIRRRYLTEQQSLRAFSLSIEVSKMLTALRSRIRDRKPNKR